jgi:hypothetical protein
MSKRFSPKFSKVVTDAKQQGYASGLIVGSGKGYKAGFSSGLMSGLIASCAALACGFLLVAYCYIFPLP